MILEGLVTTRDRDGAAHLAPMGPRIASAEFRELLLRPFPTSQTCQNLLAHRAGVFHVTDDALLLARAAIGKAKPLPAIRYAKFIEGYVLEDCCRYYEFRVTTVDDSQERIAICAEVVHAGRVRDFFGFNRAKHAVVEAAILATRVSILSTEEIENEFRRLEIIVGKTGGAHERAAMTLLREYVAEARP